MEHTKKMILVEPRVLESLHSREPPVIDATSQNLRELDQSMRQILDGNEDEKSKADMYQQALWRYLNRFDQYSSRPMGKVQLTSNEKNERDETEPQTDESNTFTANYIERDVIESVPKSMKNKAERLLQRLKAHPEIKWNSRGELEYQGQLIRNSNITDLVNDVLRKRKSARDPLGWQTFAEALQNINVPQDLIGNPSRRNYVKTRDFETPKNINISPRNVALSNLNKLVENTVSSDDRYSKVQSETPKKWKKGKNYKKKQKKYQRRLYLKDWQTV